ncbi:hypothetical protein JTB14_026899 [Gonioctena quinquepunctata]|nr:hypothetical protein JTB14_026899 [Gonioctena quinquepunctata]
MFMRVGTHSRGSALCLVIISFLLLISQNSGVRVCESWLEYYNPRSQNCFDNPDGPPSDTSQILQRWGCTTEEFQMPTEDGYYIQIVRAYKDPIKNPTPIVMGHGIYMNSLGFVDMFNKTLAYQLIQRGHQIFHINFRGTIPSTGHVNLTQDDLAYWQFSFHHMGKYDIPAALDLVEGKADGEKAIYIGYSMGTSAINVYSILYPEEAAKRLVGCIEMAPVANLTNIRSIVRPLSFLWPALRAVLKTLGYGKVLSRNEIINKFCSSQPIAMFFCYSIRVPVFGAHYDMLDPLYLPVSLQQNPDAIATMMIDHYYQIMKSEQFQQYDFGAEKNLVEYGSRSPPVYDFSKIRVPVAVFVGVNDYLSEIKNARSLYNNLPIASQGEFNIIADPKWTHSDFVLSKNMQEYLNGGVIKAISKMISDSHR